MAWTKSPDQNFHIDRRGWPKNKLRRYTSRDESRVIEIFNHLNCQDGAYFTGATAILQEYLRLFPQEQELSLRFIGRTLAKYGLSQKPKTRNKGASRYLHYPEYSITHLGESLLEIDFIGKKFIRGRSEPVNFIAFSLRMPRKLKYFKRVEAETADEVIKHCCIFFERFEKPEVVKIDNGFAFAGSGPHPRTISKVITFLLKEKIIPVFTAPRKPWNQASVEGANSIFSRKFWLRFQFHSLAEIDTKLEEFNKAYQQYLQYTKPGITHRRNKNQQNDFLPVIYFIRKVYEDDQTRQGFIEVAKEKISLPQSFINMFVLARWNLVKEQLSVCFENDQKLETLEQMSFKINPKSKLKMA